MYHFCLGGEHKYKEGEIYVVYKGVGQRGGKFISYRIEFKIITLK